MTPIDRFSSHPPALSPSNRVEDISSQLQMPLPSNPIIYLNNSISEPQYLESNEKNHNHGVVAVTILAVSMVIFIIFAVVGNVLVILTIIRHKGMKTRTNMFITNLAVADILVALFNMPFSLATVIYGGWIFGDVFCQFNGFVVPLFFIVSIHTLIYISIHKYISITRPFSHTMTPRKIMAMIAATWLWGIICASATLKGGNHVVYKKGASQCGPSIPDELNEYIHSLLITTCNYIVPLIVMSFCYFNIFKEIHDHMIRIRETSNVDLQNSLQQQRRISFTLFLVLACFVVCWTPFIGYSCAAAFSKDKEKIPLLANPVAYWCGYMNSACNPVIYALRSPSFRQGYKEIICSQPTYALAGSTITRPSISPFPSLHGKCRKRLSDRAVLPIQNLKIASSPTRSFTKTKRVVFKNTKWSSFPSLHFRSLLKNQSKALEFSYSNGDAFPRRPLEYFEHSSSSHARINDGRDTSHRNHFDKSSLFRRATSMPSVMEIRSAENSPASIGHTSVVNKESKFQCPPFKSEDNICADRYKGSKNYVQIFSSVGKLPHDGHCTEDKVSFQKTNHALCPSVVVNFPSPESSNEYFHDRCSDGSCSEVEQCTTRHFSTLNCLSRSCSDEVRSRDHRDVTPNKNGYWSPVSIKSLEMGRNRRRNSNVNAKKAELSPLTMSAEKPESPLYSASREQLMKWMSQDCLDRLEMIEKEFRERFLDCHDSFVISTYQQLTSHKGGKGVSGT